MTMDLFQNSSQGKLYWITGLSGSGKTTIGTALYQEIKKTTDRVVYLDGDTLRKYIAYDVGYSYDERKALGKKYSGLCQMLVEQGFIVICSTIAMFDDVRDLNRTSIQNYIEVYVKVELDTLVQRDQKKLYSSKTKNVVGIDIPPELPKNPDIIIENSNGNMEKIISNILKYEVT